MVKQPHDKLCAALARQRYHLVGDFNLQDAQMASWSSPANSLGRPDESFEQGRRGGDGPGPDRLDRLVFIGFNTFS